MTPGQQAYEERRRQCELHGSILPTWQELSSYMRAGWEAAKAPWVAMGEAGPAPSSAFAGSTILRDPIGVTGKTGPIGQTGVRGHTAAETTKTDVEDMQKRVFATGANRDTAAGKLDFEGFLSPLVLEAYGRYMDFNTEMADGSRRASDNWQKGIPQDVYLKSAFRHFHDWWSWSRGDLKPGREPVTAICGLLFNAMGYLHEMLKKDESAVEQALATTRLHRDQLRRPVAGPPELTPVKSAGERYRDAHGPRHPRIYEPKLLWKDIGQGGQAFWNHQAEKADFK